MRYPSLNNGLFLFLLGWVSLLPVIFYLSQQVMIYYYLIIGFDVFHLLIFLVMDGVTSVFFSIPFIIYNSYIRSYQDRSYHRENHGRILKRGSSGR